MCSKFIKFVGGLFLIALTSACASDDILSIAEVTTLEVRDIAETTVLTGGVITSDNTKSVIASGVCWSESLNPTIEEHKTIDVLSDGRFASKITGLAPGTTYYVRAYATNSAGTAYGNLLTFTTEGFSVVTNPVTDILTTAATFNGAINTNSSGNDITECGFYYSLLPLPSTDDPKVVAGKGKGPFKATVNTLAKNKAYYVRAYSIINAKLFYGEPEMFTTGDGVVSLSTVKAQNITYQQASISALIASTGGTSITERGVCYSTSPSPTTESSKVVSLTNTLSFTVTLNSLSRNTQYYARAYVKNESGVVYGNVIEFKTTNGQPQFGRVNDHYVGAFSLIWGYTFADLGAVPITDKGMCYSQSPNPTINDTKVSDGATAKVDTLYKSKLAVLNERTSYYARPYALTSLGVVYGEELSFTTGQSKVGDPSNCYIVAPTTTISIPVSRANEGVSGSITATDQLQASLVWTDNRYRVGLRSNIVDLGVLSNGSSGRIYVSVGSAIGNAVVSVKVNGIIRWSWHIWVTDYIPNAADQIMDRNLGALSATYSATNTNVIGLMYQWGRKDPFVSPIAWGGTERLLYREVDSTYTTSVNMNVVNNLVNTVRNPIYFYYNLTSGDWYTNDRTKGNDNLWATTKTVYDPCPKGWKVPSKEDFKSLNGTNFVWVARGRQKTSDQNFFPAGGYRQLGSLRGVGTQGHYMSSTALSQGYADALNFNQDQVLDENLNRCDAGTMRCVKE